MKTFEFLITALHDLASAYLKLHLRPFFPYFLLKPCRPFCFLNVPNHSLSQNLCSSFCLCVLQALLMVNSLPFCSTDTVERPFLDILSKVAYTSGFLTPHRVSLFTVVTKCVLSTVLQFSVCQVNRFFSDIDIFPIIKWWHVYLDGEGDPVMVNY